MKLTDNMTIEELFEEKELLEKKSKFSSIESARLKKITNEILKRNNKTIVTDSFTNDDMKSHLQLKYVNIDDIDMPEYDDRTGIEEDRIQQLANSIKEHGLIQNPVLKQLPNGRYEKKVGRRRIIATKLNGEKKILVKILPEGLTEEEEDFIIWDENNQREDLNLYDKVRFHLRFIKRTFNFNEDKEAISFIHNCHFYKKQEDASKENKDEVVKLELLLNKLGSYKTVSSLMNNLQVLNFNELVLDAMKESKISYKLAYLLNKSIPALQDIYKADQNEVTLVLNFIINKEFSVNEAESYLNNIIKKSIVKDELDIKFNKAIKKLNKKIDSISDNDKKEKLIAMVNNFLKEF
jgi:ParB family chromosome partitioning protein